MLSFLTVIDATIHLIIEIFSRAIKSTTNIIGNGVPTELTI